ncbi:MAG: WD40 repeat domain-containing protein [Candidatus Marinimicrobia bacterium]|nr:WD40 repeat domain-containing protein [Candidatus Neomarinimicrobiota bacterium]
MLRRSRILLFVALITCLPLLAGNLMYHDMFLVDRVRDSLMQAGWDYRTEFPYFMKSARTASSPKSCVFSPDGKYVYVTLLGQRNVAVQVYSVDPFEKIRTVSPPCRDESKNYGFAEGVCYEPDGSFWFTRMTTGEYFVYHPGSDSLEAARSAGGVWTKSLEFSPNHRQVAMSHWISRRISVIDARTHRLIRDLSTSQIPRGVAWIGNDTLAVALYGGANSTDCGIEIFDVRTGKKIQSMPEHRSAMRDVRYDPRKKMLYYDDMRFALVYQYDWIRRETLDRIEVDSHPNTIRLTPDGEYLFVSCRGPNNPEGYTLPSPRNGKIVVIRDRTLPDAYLLGAGQSADGP